MATTKFTRVLRDAEGNLIADKTVKLHYVGGGEAATLSQVSDGVYTALVESGEYDLYINGTAQVNINPISVVDNKSLAWIDGGDTIYLRDIGNQVIIGDTSALVGTNLSIVSTGSTAVAIARTNATLRGFTLGVDGNDNAVMGTTGEDHLLFKTNSVERLRVIDSGSVGIGRSDPGYLVDIRSVQSGSGAPISQTALNVYAKRTGVNNVAGDEVRIQLEVAGSANQEYKAGAIGGALMGISAGTKRGDLVFYTAQTGSLIEQMRIATDASSGHGDVVMRSGRIINDAGLFRVLGTGLDAVTTNEVTIETSGNELLRASGSTVTINQTGSVVGPLRMRGTVVGSSTAALVFPDGTTETSGISFGTGSGRIPVYKTADQTLLVGNSTLLRAGSLEVSGDITSLAGDFVGENYVAVKNGRITFGDGETSEMSLRHSDVVDPYITLWDGDLILKENLIVNKQIFASGSTAGIATAALVFPDGTDEAQGISFGTGSARTKIYKENANTLRIGGGSLHINGGLVTDDALTTADIIADSLDAAAGNVACDSLNVGDYAEVVNYISAPNVFYILASADKVAAAGTNTEAGAFDVWTHTKTDSTSNLIYRTNYVHRTGNAYGTLYAKGSMALSGGGVGTGSVTFGSVTGSLHITGAASEGNYISLTGSADISGLTTNTVYPCTITMAGNGSGSTWSMKEWVVAIKSVA